MVQRPHRTGSTLGGAVSCSNDSHHKPFLFCPVQEARWVCCLPLVPIKVVFQIRIGHKHLFGKWTRIHCVCVETREEKGKKSNKDYVDERIITVGNPSSNGLRSLLGARCRCSEMFSGHYLEFLWHI